MKRRTTWHRRIFATSLRDVRGRRSAFRARTGFTLLELMVATTIIAILTLVVAAPVRRARERAYVAATKADMRNALQAAQMYEAINGRWPTQLTELKSQGFQVSKDTNFCAFQSVNPGGGAIPYLRMEAQHRGSRTRVEVRYPIWTRNYRETEVTGLCTALSF